MKEQWESGWRMAGALALATALSLTLMHAGAARGPLPVSTTFTGAHAERTWPLVELDPSLPRDWTGFDFLVLEFRASSSQRFELGLETDRGRIAKRIGPFAGVWVRAAIPLRFYREPAGSAVDLAATYNQPRSSYWINLDSSRVGPTTDVRGITVAMIYPVGTPTFELRAIGLARTDPGDAVLEGKPLVDEFGQYTRAEWPGKAHTLGDLKGAWEVEAAALREKTADRCPYGGFLRTSAKTTGFFRVEQIDGRWWFVCPDGHLFFSAGVNGVGTTAGTRVQDREDLFAALPPADLISPPRGAAGRGAGPAGSFYTWNLVRRFGSEGWRAKWAQFTARRLASWGLNSIHYWGTRSLEEGAEPRVPYAQMLRGWQTAASIMGMPDVYAPDFPERVEQTAASQLDARKDDAWMLGYFIGNEPPWPGRESQLADAILAGPASEMQRRLKAHLAQEDSAERRRAFAYAAFERYLEVVNAACRRHAPRHLNLGIRFGGAGHDELVRALRGVDVFSYNTYRYTPARATLDRLYALAQRPILIGEFHIGVPERGLAPGLVQAMNQEERGAAYRYFVEQGAAHPALVGTHWFQWLDQPVTGRNDGENYNIGFVDVTDQPYAELVAAAKATHARLFDVHRGKTPPITRVPKASGAGTPLPPDQPATTTATGTPAPAGKVAPRPLYRDPPFDAPTDPVLTFNAERGTWLMYYTARRGSLSPEEAPAVRWVHGTNIGVAESADGGATWAYRGTADISYGKDAHPNDSTYWAPEVIWAGGTYHMFVSYVPGIFTDWNHPREIVHLTSRDGLQWTTVGQVDLKSDKVIDACVTELPGGVWRMWYKDERKPLALSYADSADLNTWETKGNAVTEFNGEGPKVFRWRGRYWLVADCWRNGMRVWSSDDATRWVLQQEALLGHHGDVVVSGDRAWWFYFGSDRRTAIDVVELEVRDRTLLAGDPALPTHIDLKPEREPEK